MPLDDDHAMLISHSGFPTRPAPREFVENAADAFAEVGGYEPRTNDPRTYFDTTANKHNDYQRDLGVEKNLMHCGIPFIVNLQDRAMTELMCGPGDEPLYDRTQEHLGTTDTMVITVRRAAARTPSSTTVTPASCRPTSTTSSSTGCGPRRCCSPRAPTGRP